MKPEEIRIALNLGSSVTFLPGSWDKRFSNQMYQIAFQNPEKEITASQREWLFRLLYKYRKQVPKTYEAFKDIPECSRKEKKNSNLSKHPEDKWYHAESNIPEQKNLFSDL